MFVLCHSTGHKGKQIISMRRGSSGFEWWVNDATHSTGVCRLSPASPCSRLFFAQHGSTRPMFLPLLEDRGGKG